LIVNRLKKGFEDLGFSALPFPNVNIKKPVVVFPKSLYPKSWGGEKGRVEILECPTSFETAKRFTNHLHLLDTKKIMNRSDWVNQ